MTVSGEQNIRGIDIDKLAKGFAEAEYIFKQFLTQTPTSAREIRWYKKTSGTLDSTDTTGITGSQISNVSQLALPDVVEQSWTRQTSYVRKYFVESPWFSDEDIKDSDIDILAGNVRDLTLTIAKQVDTRIWNVLTEDETAANINYTMDAQGTGWSDTTNGNPILDLLSGARSIMAQDYDTSNLVTLVNPTQYQNLLNYIITVKGSSIPAFASGKVESGVLMSIIGQKIVVSNNVTAGKVVTFVPQRSATWKTFTPITARTLDSPGIGTKIRVWEEGEGILTDPKAVHLLSGA